MVVPLRSCSKYCAWLWSDELHLSHHVCDQEINPTLGFCFGAHHKLFCPTSKVCYLETRHSGGLGHRKQFFGASKYPCLQQWRFSEVRASNYSKLWNQWITFFSRTVEAWFVTVCAIFYSIIVFLVIITLDLVVARLLQVLIYQGSHSLSEAKQITVLDKKNSRKYFSSLEDIYQGIK